MFEKHGNKALCLKFSLSNEDFHILLKQRIYHVLNSKNSKIINMLGRDPLKTCYLGQQFSEVFKQIGAVKVTVIVNVQLGDKAGDPPQLDQSFQSHLLHLIGHLNVL